MSNEQFKLPPDQLGDIVGQSMGYHGNASQIELFTVSIGRPFSQDDGHDLWYCSYSVQLAYEILASGTVAGIDSLQALLLCLQVLQSEVSRLSNSGRIPVPESFLIES